MFSISMNMQKVQENKAKWNIIFKAFGNYYQEKADMPCHDMKKICEVGNNQDIEKHTRQDNREFARRDIPMLQWV